MSSVIPYTPASVHSYLTCLCVTILIDISVLPDTFRWLLCMTSDWGSYKTPMADLSKLGCSRQLVNLMLKFLHICLF